MNVKILLTRCNYIKAFGILGAIGKEKLLRGKKIVKTPQLHNAMFDARV